MREPTVSTLAPTLGPCSSSDFAALSGNNLVNAIAGAGPCLDVLFSYDTDVQTVIAPANATLVANAISLESANLTGNATRLRNMSYFLQIGFFHEFYEPSVTYDATTVSNAQQAMIDIAASVDFLDESQPVKDLRQQWIISLDSTNGTDLTLPAVEAILSRYRSNPAHAMSFQERVTAFNAFFTLGRQINNNFIALGTGSPWYSLINQSLHDVIDAYALDLTTDSDTEPITNNAIFVLGHFSFLEPARAAAGHTSLTSAYQAHPQYLGPWLRSVIDLEHFYNGELDNGTPLPLAQIRSDVAAIALPNTFSFDQGRLTFRTPLSLSAIEAQYEAMKEVGSQFFRKCSSLDPVPGDLNESLTLVIYGSPSDYQLYQPFLYGYNTNNGGIFIEGDGTLFTYDRTPQQSIYTLEELLRHEYVHYLDSRYLVTGGFYGPGTLYQGGRLDWYSEGLAEFLVGSTRSLGVLPRGTLLSQIEGDSSRMSVSQILSATYSSGFGFYRYAGTFFKFLEEDEADRLVTLFEAILGNNLANLDALYASWSADSAFQNAYDTWLTNRINDYNTSNGPFAEDVPTTPTPTNLPENNSELIRSELRDSLSASGASTFSVWAERFHFEDVITIPTQGATPGALREVFDETIMDGFVDQLAPLLMNFESAVAWCGNIQVVGQNATARYTMEGPFNPTPADQTPPASPVGLVVTDSTGVADLQWHPNDEADLTGYNVYRSTSYDGLYSLLNGNVVSPTSYHDGTAIPDQYYAVAAVDASGNESPLSIQIQGGASGRILLVDGHSTQRGSYFNAYSSELDQRNIAYDRWIPAIDGEPTAAVLSPYTQGIVIWSVGYYVPSDPLQLSPGRQAAIEDYLDNGGNLIFSGAYMASNLDQTSLFTDYFHAQHVRFNVDLPELLEVPGSPLGLGLGATMSTTLYESEIDLNAPAQSALTYDPTSGAGMIDSSGTAVFTVDDGYRVVYFGFPFADLTQESRSDLMDGILDWMVPTQPRVEMFPGIAGELNEFAVYNAKPGERIFFLAGIQPANLSTPCSGTFLGIDPVRILARKNADASGFASLSFPIGGGRSGLTILIQAAIVPSCELTDVLQLTLE